MIIKFLATKHFKNLPFLGCLSELPVVSKNKQFAAYGILFLWLKVFQKRYSNTIILQVPFTPMNYWTVLLIAGLYMCMLRIRDYSKLKIEIIEFK